MPVSDAVTKQLGEWIGEEDGELHYAVQAHPVLVDRSRTFPHGADICPFELDQAGSEDKFGCARGVLWAIVFQAAVAVGAAVCWKLRLFAR